MSEEKMIPIADFVEEMVAKADCTKRQDCQGFTGFRDIDNLTNGMKKGGLILLAARPGVGKSTLASNIAGNMAIDCHRRVAFFCMEMGNELFAQSIVCSRAHVKGSALRNNKMTSGTNRQGCPAVYRRAPRLECCGSCRYGARDEQGKETRSRHCRLSAVGDIGQGRISRRKTGKCCPRAEGPCQRTPYSHHRHRDAQPP